MHMKFSITQNKVFQSAAVESLRRLLCSRIIFVEEILNNGERNVRNGEKFSNIMAQDLGRYSIVKLSIVYLIATGFILIISIR